MIRRVALGLIAAVLILGLSGIGVGSAQTVQSKDTFVMGVESDIATMDPNAAQGWAALSVWGNMYQALVSVSGLDWHIIPGLAESWENPDALTWKFRLRLGVKFHNGQALTSHDFAYSAGRILGTVDPKYPGFARQLYREIIADIQTPDDRTIIIKTLKPEASFIHQIGGIFIVPKAYAEKVGDEELAKSPVGTNNYKFKERRIGESTTLEAFKDFWNKKPKPYESGPAGPKYAAFKILPEMQTRIAALRAGEISAAMGITMDMGRDLEKTPGIKVYYTAINQPQYIMCNWRAKNDPQTGAPNPLCDLRVRQALSHAVDVDAIISHYLTGREYRTTLVGKGSIGYNPKAFFYDYNPEKAKALLKEAGYPNGFPLTFFVLQDVRPEIEALAQYWRDAGIDVKFQHTTSAVVIRQVIKKQLYGCTLWNSGRGSDTVKGQATMLMYDGQYAIHGENKKIEEMAEAQQHEMNEAKRARLIHEMFQIIRQEAWFVPLWEPVALRAIRAEWEYKNWPAVAGILLSNLKHRP